MNYNGIYFSVLLASVPIINHPKTSIQKMSNMCITFLLLFTAVDISPNWIPFFIVGHWILTIVIKVILEVPTKRRYPDLSVMVCSRRTLVHELDLVNYLLQIYASIKKSRANWTKNQRLKH